MNHEVFFNQGCPVCGRMLRVPVQLLGHRVYCQHCGGGFVATSTITASADDRAGPRSRSEVVDELLARATAQLQEGLHDGCELVRARALSISHD